MPFLALTVVANALFVGSLNASVASPVGRMHARITTDRQRFELEDATSKLVRRGGHTNTVETIRGMCAMTRAALG